MAKLLPAPLAHALASPADAATRQLYGEASFRQMPYEDLCIQSQERATAGAR